MAKSKKTSAGLLMYRHRDGDLEVFLAHPGGPYGRSRDAGAWSIPKGEIEPDEDLEATAVREFAEEIGIPATGPRTNLGCIKQRGGKTVYCWAFEGGHDWADGRIPDSNTFELELPRGSGKMVSFPEVDKAAFFLVPVAKEKINVAQAELIDRLVAHLSASNLS
ncbi:MAG: putative NUDIX family NTP pyrophosphohydrolase [Myxococcota bacterium]|jgi:predicted NUDIX family NTP pyrophosphohydrolase